MVALKVCMSVESSLLEYFVVSTSKNLLTFRNGVLSSPFGSSNAGSPPLLDSSTRIWRQYAPQIGPGSTVGIATGYGLDGPGIESRWGRDFSAPVQTRPGTHPASCTIGTGSFPRVESARGVTVTPQCNNVWVEELSVTKRESMFVPSFGTHHCQPYPSLKLQYHLSIHYLKANRKAILMSSF